MPFTPDQLQAPDTINLKKVRPFNDDEVLDNQDGTRSTERTMSLNYEGKEVLVPSLWMTDKGPVDLSRNPEVLMRAVRSYEDRSKLKFPRFNTPDEATAFAKERHTYLDKGVSPGPLAK